MAQSRILDRWGNPVRLASLREEQAAPTVFGVRSPVHNSLSDGLDPVKLAHILRDADEGDALRYLELAEIIEERDLHYVGILGTRKRSVAQLEITVDAASDDPADVAIAERIRDWLKRDELQEEIFNILDALGKGYSFTEIVWERPGGYWQPDKLIWRDPRWFRFARHDLSTPLMLDAHGSEVPLPAFRFIYTEMKAKSGLALRSGLARIAAWAWMFKAFTQRDWTIFTQTYGQPMRIGRFHEGATDEDKRTLVRAVSNIAGDCAAVIPQGMLIEFVESKSVGASADLFERRCDWIDRQMSKAVLGQTATTDAVTGGLGSGKEHRQVQEDIERADAMALAGILNRDLIRPWVQLNHGPRDRYPRLRIARPDVEDVTRIATAVSILVKAGLPISKTQIRSRLGFEEPRDAGDVLGANTVQDGSTAASDGAVTGAVAAGSFLKRQSGEFQRQVAAPGGDVALQAQEASTGLKSGGDDQGEDQLEPAVRRMVDDLDPVIAEIFDVVENILGSAASLPEAQELVRAAFPAVETKRVEQILAQGLIATQAGGYLDGADASGE